MRSLFLFTLILSGLTLASCGSNRKAAKSEKPVAKSPEAKPSETRSETRAAERKLQEKYSAALGVDADKISNMKLYRFIDEWYGVPYKYAGKSKTGVDCSGFTCLLYNDVYSAVLQGSAASLYTGCAIIDKDDLREGDLVFFKIEKDRISHVGIYLHNNKFVHASTSRGIIISDLTDAYYRKYFFKAGRPKTL